MPRYRRRFASSQCAFLTIVTGNRLPWLRDASEKRRLLRALALVAEGEGLRNAGHVILDDHFHWMFSVPECNIPEIVSGLKRKIIFQRREESLPWARLWQKRYYDHVIRDDDDFRNHLDYIHFNPVKHGYVTRTVEYPWSSFHAWCERGVYTSEWGDSEPRPIAAWDLE